MESKQQLIDLVRESPCLYLKTDPGFANKVMKENAWTKIGQELGKTATETKKAWESLRNQYLAFRRKLLNPTGSAAGHRPYFRYEAQMEFCTDVPFDEDSNFSNVLGDENSSNSQLYEVPLVPSLPQGDIVLEFDTPRPSKAPPSSAPARVHKKFSGKHKSSQFEEKLLGIIKDDSPDEFGLFFQSMALKLRRVYDKNPGLASDIQLKVHQIINEGERETREVTTKSVPTPSVS